MLLRGCNQLQSAVISYNQLRGANPLPAPGGGASTGVSTDAVASAKLVVDAARPWSVATHALWPHSERKLAEALLRVGYLIARGYGEHEGVLQQLWRDHVLPCAVERRRGVSGGVAAVEGTVRAHKDTGSSMGSSEPLEGSQSAPLPPVIPPRSFAAATPSVRSSPPVAKTNHALAGGKIVAHYLY